MLPCGINATMILLAHSFICIVSIHHHIGSYKILLYLWNRLAVLKDQALKSQYFNLCNSRNVYLLYKLVNY